MGFRSTFYHIYLKSSFYPEEKGRHDCLRSGFWCLENLIERPFDIFSFIKHKLKAGNLFDK